MNTEPTFYVAGHRRKVGSASCGIIRRLGRRHAELNRPDQAAVRAFFLAEETGSVHLNAAEAGDISFNSESLRRDENFVARKIIWQLANIDRGPKECLFMDNIDVLRGWGHAKDHVSMQWLMPQQDKPEDFVIATGVRYSVRELIEKLASASGKQIRWEGTSSNEVGYWDKKPTIRMDPRYFRPTEVETLLGDPGKAKEEPGRMPEIMPDEMVQEMVLVDLADGKKHALLKSKGYNVTLSME